MGTSSESTTSSVEADILGWAAKRKPWQQEVLRQLAGGHSFSDEEIEELAKKLIEGGASKGTTLSAADLPKGQADAPTISLTSIGNAVNINALLCDQTVLFAAAGLTVVYGDNASGKGPCLFKLKA